MDKHKPQIHKRLFRPAKRYLGGVCEGIGKKYKIAPIILRLLFIVTSLFLAFPALIYLILWLTVPNYKPITDLKNKKLYQGLGIIIGGVFGFIFGFFGTIYFYGIQSGIILLFFRNSLPTNRCFNRLYVR